MSLFFMGKPCALELEGDSLFLTEVAPLFNVHSKKLFVSDAEITKLYPGTIEAPKASIIANNQTVISVDSFLGDVIFKDFLINTDAPFKEVEISVDAPDGISITPRIVTSWYQSGSTTKKYKAGGVITYELLLSDDRTFLMNGSWIESENGGWIYNAPDVDITNTLLTVLTPINKRILFRIETSLDLVPGNYIAKILIKDVHNHSARPLAIPVKISVKPFKLIDDNLIQQKRILFTAFSINDHIQRSGSYVNTMRLPGDTAEKEQLLIKYFKDIKRHGFNGVTIRDWEGDSLERTLKILSNIGFKYVVLHATTPVNRKYKADPNPILGTGVRELFSKYNLQLYFYGHDEIGGNKLLDKQLRLNQMIHNIGGKSVNAVFWNDLARANIQIGSDTSKCFDMVAYSMGSNGHKKMFDSLPLKPRSSSCDRKGVDYLTYWHPHVENPVINRLFMGFWLWASGFDGIIPHGYYFPSHIEKILSKKDKQRGVSNATSPYNDWSYWLPGEVLRHHNSVYPSSSGPVGTLQWEGILSGYIDLKYVLSLEAKLENNNIDRAVRTRIMALLNEIRQEVLMLESPYLSDKESLEYLHKLEYWKKSIAGLLYE